MPALGMRLEIEQTDHIGGGKFRALMHPNPYVGG
jgi:hypothetical protein